MRRGVLWLMVGLSFLVGERPSWGQSPPVAFRRVLIPPQKASSLLSQEGKTLHPLRPEQFHKLVDLVQNAAVAPEAVRGARVVRITHRVRFQPPHVLLGTSVLEIRHRAKHPVLITLAPWHLALTDAQWTNPQEAAVVGTGPQGEFQLLVAREGTLLLHWVLQGRSQDRWGVEFPLQFPTALHQRLEVEVPQGYRFQLHPPLPQHLLSSAEGKTSPSRWQVQLPPGASLRLSFRSTSAQVGSLPSYDQRNLVTISSDQMRLVSRFALGPGQVEQALELEVPSPLRIRQVEVNGRQEEFEPLDAQGRRVRLRGTFQPGCVVQVEAVGSVQLRRRVVVPRAQILPGRWQSETTQLQIRSPLVLRALEPQQCRQISPWQGGRVRFQHFNPHAHLVVVLDGSPTRWQADMAAVVRVRPGRLEQRLAIRLWPQQGELFHVHALLRPGWTIDRLQTDPAELLHRWRVEEGPRRRIHMELARPAEPHSPIWILLELHRPYHRSVAEALDLAALWPLELQGPLSLPRRFLSWSAELSGGNLVSSAARQVAATKQDPLFTHPWLEPVADPPTWWQLDPGEVRGRLRFAGPRRGFRAQVRTEVKLTPQQWQVVALVTLRPEQGELRQVELVTSSWVGEPQVRLRGHRGALSWKALTSEPGRVRRWQVEFGQGVQEEATLELQWQGKLHSQEPLLVPLLGVAGAQEAPAHISILASPWMPVAWKVHQLVPSDPALQENRQGLLASWSYDGRALAEQPELFQLSLRPQNAEKFLRPTVWFQQVDTRWCASIGALEYHCQLWMQWPTAGQLRFELPADQEVLALSVNHRPHQWRRQGRQLEVRLAAPWPSPRELKLELWTRKRWQPGGPWAEVPPLGLKCAYPILHRQWRIWARGELGTQAPDGPGILKRWFGPLAKSFWAYPSSSVAHRGTLERLLAQWRRQLAAGQDSLTWGEALLHLHRVAQQHRLLLLVDAQALAQSGFSSQTSLRLPLPESSQQFFAAQGLHLELVGNRLILSNRSSSFATTAGPFANPFSSPEESWPLMSVGQWMWWSSATEDIVPEVYDPSWSLVAEVHAAQVQQPVRVPWLPWWRGAGWVAALVLGVVFWWAFPRWPRALAVVAVGLLALAAWVPEPYTLLSSRMSLGLWAACLAGLLRAAGHLSAPAAAPSDRASTVVVTSATVVLMIATWHQAWAQKPAATKVYPVYVPEEPNPEYYFVPDELYRYLVDWADRISGRPRRWLLRQASYRVQIGEPEEPVRVRALYHLQVFRSQEPVRLEFAALDDPLRPKQVVVDGAEVEAEWDAQGRLVLRLEEPGMHQLELLFQVPSHSQEGQREFRLPIVRSAAARVEVIAAETLVLEAPQSWGPMELEPSGQLWRGQLGPTSVLHLRWHPREQNSSPLAEVDQLLWLKVHPGSMILETQLHCRPMGHPLEQLRIWVDPALQLLPVEDPAVQEVSKVPESKQPHAHAPVPGLELFRIRLREPATGPVKISLGFVLQEASGIGRWRVPRVMVDQNGSVQHWLALSVNSTLEHHLHGTQDLEPILGETFVDLWDQAQETPTTAFECGSSWPEQLELWTQPRTWLPTAQSLVRWELYSGVARMSYQAQLQHPRSAMLTLRMQVPISIQVESVRLLNEQEAEELWWQRWEDQVIVWLPDPLDEFTIRLEGWCAIPQQGSWRPPQVRLLQVEEKQQGELFHHGQVLATLAPPAQVQDASEAPAGMFVAGRWTQSPQNPSPLVKIQPNRPLYRARLDYTLLQDQQDRPWRIMCQIRLEVRRGFVDQVPLRIEHASGQAVQLLSPGKLEVVRSDAQGLQVVYRPEQKIEDHQEIRLQVAWNPRPTQTQPLPRILPLEAEEVKTFVLAPSMRASPWWRWEVRQMKLLPVQGQPLWPVSDPRAWQATGPEWSMALVPRPTQVSSQLLVAHHHLLLDPDQPLLLESFLLVWAPGVESCTLVLPSGGDVLGVRAHGQPVVWTGVDSDRIRLHLPPATLPVLIHLLWQADSAQPLQEVATRVLASPPRILQTRPTDSELWSLWFPRFAQVRVDSLPRVDASQHYLRWCQGLIQQLRKGPFSELPVQAVERWWQGVSQPLGLTPVDQKSASGLPAAWLRSWHATWELQQHLSRLGVSWEAPSGHRTFPLVPRFVDLQRYQVIHAFGPRSTPPRVAIHRAPAPARGNWLHGLMILSMAVGALWLPWLLKLLVSRWSCWLLIAVGLSWAVLLTLWPVGAGLALWGAYRLMRRAG